MRAAVARCLVLGRTVINPFPYSVQFAPRGVRCVAAAVIATPTASLVAVGTQSMRINGLQ